MIERGMKRLSMRALIIDDELTQASAEGRAARNLVAELQAREVQVVEATSAADGHSAILSDSAIHAILMDWTLGEEGDHDAARELLKVVRSRNDKIPIFLMAERGEASSIPIDVMEMVDEYIWTLEDTASFVGGRVVAAIRRYWDIMLPPMAAALMKFTQEYEYSWHTPGHAGGTAFLKSPVGRVFFDYFGENMLRSDLSISVGALGSLLDHTGPIGAHERYAARVFGAHRTYCVTNGTSMSNRVIFMAAVGRDQVALCDRNAHKSIEHSLVMTGAIPSYLVPLRNRYGIIGPIPPARLKAAALKADIKANPLVTEGHRPAAGVRVVTNSTYDGLMLPCPPGGGAARPDRRPDPLRRGVVRLRPLQPDLSRPARDARRSQEPQGTDGLRHPFDPQAARGALPGVVPAHPRRAERDPPLAVQRVVHDAGVHLAALSDHRLQRHHGGDDGRARRRGAHQRVDRGGGGVPADDGPGPPRVRPGQGSGSSTPGTRKSGKKKGKKVAFADASPEFLATRARRLGAASGRDRGTASATWRTGTACWTRSRSPS